VVRRADWRPGADGTQRWRVLAKHGADLPPQSASQLASIFLRTGETYDVEVLRERPESLTFRIISAENITNRAAFVAGARPGEPPPRVTLNIPLLVR